MIRKISCILTGLSIVLLLNSCGGAGDVKKSKEYLELKAELDKLKASDSTEATNIAAYKKLNDDFMAGKKDDFMAGVADNYLDHNPDTAMSKKQGKEACDEMFTVITSAFTEMSMSYSHIMATGDLVFCHATMSGKNSGPMGPTMPATGKSYKDVEFYEVVRYENGKLAERWGLMDMNTMMAQMGMMGQ